VAQRAACAKGGDVSSLDSALIEICHIKESLALAGKKDINAYNRKWYTALIGHCRFAEKYIEQAKEKEDEV